MATLSNKVERALRHILPADVAGELIGYLASLNVTAGTASASSALVMGASKDIDTLDVAADGLKIGGTAMTATAAELNAIADLSANGGLLKVKKIAISTTPTGSEQDTSFDLPAKALLLDVLIDVTTAEATGTTKTLDVGLLSSESGGDADGFVDGVSVASTGLKRAGVTVTAGVFASTLRGVLMRSFTAGTDADDRGLYDENPHLSTAVTAKSVSYTAGSNDFAEFRGSIYLIYMEIG